MSLKSRNRGTYITLETRSQDDKELPQWHCRRLNQHIAGRCSIQYVEVDETKTTRYTQIHFSLVFPETYSGPDKYSRLQNKQKIDLIRINYPCSHEKRLYVPECHHRPSYLVCCKLGDKQHHDSRIVLQLIEVTIVMYGKPKIINSDKVSQFTSLENIDRYQAKN